MNKKDSDKEGKILHPVKVLSLTEYQKNAVVSRTLVDKKSGTVTLFAFDEGQGLSEHLAPFDALVYLAAGQAEITVSGRVEKMSAGEIMILPANQPHALRAVSRFKMILTMVR